MTKLKYHLTLRQKLAMTFRLLANDHIPYKTKFLKYHLIRRKYILSKSSEFFGKNKFEPAPLLNKRVLDVGCGLNHISDELSFRGADILAIDTDKKIIQAAKLNAEQNGSPVDYQNKSLYDINPEEEKFDVILLLDFLKSSNIQKSLDMANKLLKNDGLIIISSSNKTIKSLIRNILVPRFLLKMYQLNIKYKDLVRLKIIKKNLEQSGFEILGTQGIDFNFFTGKWHKTGSKKVRYIMYCHKI